MTKKVAPEAPSTGPWENMHSRLVSSLMSDDYKEQSYAPIQEGDERVGEASQYVLRLAAQIKLLYDQSREYHRLIEQESHHPERQEHLYENLDDVELDLVALVVFYFKQLAYEFKGKWEGPPIFVLRDENVVVVTARHRKVYSSKRRHSSKSITAAVPFFLKIVLSSFETPVT